MLGWVVVGCWLDYVGLCMCFVCLIVVVVVVMLFLFVVVDNEGLRYDVLFMIVILVIVVLDNGLEVIVIIEYVGLYWSGWVLGI